MKKRALLSENQVKYVEDIIVKRDTANLGMPRKEVIQVISELGQEKSFFQADNHLDYLIRVKRLTHLKRLGRVVTAQATTTETGSSPRFPLRSHSLVCTKNHLFFVGIGPILNKEIKFIYRSDESDRTYVYSLVSEYTIRHILDIKT